MIKNAWPPLSTKKSQGPLEANARTDKVIDKWGHPTVLEARTLPQARLHQDSGVNLKGLLLASDGTE